MHMLCRDGGPVRGGTTNEPCNLTLVNLASVIAEALLVHGTWKATPHISTLVLKAATKKTGVAYNYVEADGGAHVYQIKFYWTPNVDHNAMLLPPIYKIIYE